MNARLVRGCLVAGLMIGATSGAFAFGRGGGSSQMGDSWLNDMQKNPRFIEPYADRDPARYRASHPREGWYDRQRAAYPYGAPARRYPWGG